MHQLIRLTVLVAASAAHAEIRVATTSFSTRGVPTELGSVYAERFATTLRASGITVTTDKDLASLVSVERQRQLLGCADSSSSCLAELAGALGAPFIVTGSVARIGNAVTLSIKVLLVEKSQAVYSLTKDLGSVEQVLDAVEAAAPEAAQRLREVTGDTAAAAPYAAARQGAPSTTPPWLLMTAGAAGVGAGIALLVSAQQLAAPLYAEPPAMDFGPEAAMQVGARTGPMRTAGWVLVGVGAAAVVGGIVWRVVQSSGPSVAFVPTSDGAAFAVGGAW